jgi:hypothetical protein
MTGLLGLAWTYLAGILIAHYLLETARRHQVESAWFILAGVATLAAVVQRGRGMTDREGDAAPFWPLAVSAIAASAVLYARSLWIGPLSDDYTLLELAPGLSGGWEFFRPLPLTVWWVVHPVLGTPGLHALNIVLHGLNAALLYRLLLAVSPGSGRAYALAGAAMFFAFPAAVESVAWSAGIFDVALVTGSLIFLTSLVNDGPRARLITIASFVAAVLCKETAAALPVLGWALSCRQRVDRTGLIVVTVVAIAYGGIRMLSATVPAVDEPVSYLAKEMLVRPFATLGVPWTTAEVAASPLVFGVLPAFVIATLVAGYALRPALGVLPLVPAVWVVAAITPLMGSFFVTANLEGSRYVYLPLVGWILLVTELAAHQRWRTARQLALAAMVAIAAAGAYGTWRHQTAWVNAASLRDRVLEEARSALTNAGCESGAFLNVPDNVDGAFVFRNGFVEAARAVGIAAERSTSPTGVGCGFEWTGAEFRAGALGSKLGDVGARGSEPR